MTYFRKIGLLSLGLSISVSSVSYSGWNMPKNQLTLPFIGMVLWGVGGYIGYRMAKNELIKARHFEDNERMKANNTAARTDVFLSYTSGYDNIPCYLQLLYDAVHDGFGSHLNCRSDLQQAYVQAIYKNLGFWGVMATTLIGGVVVTNYFAK